MNYNSKVRRFFWAAWDALTHADGRRQLWHKFLG